VILKLHPAKLQYSHSELTIFLDRRNIGCPLPRKILQGEIHDSDACSRNLPAGMRGGHLVVFDKRKKSAWRDPDCGASAVDRSSGVLYKDMQIRNGDEITSPGRRIDLGQICSISNHKS
jgi:hypothetical protein